MKFYIQVCNYATSTGGGADPKTRVGFYAISARRGADLKTQLCIYATFAGGGADLKTQRRGSAFRVIPWEGVPI